MFCTVFILKMWFVESGNLMFSVILKISY
jgi:hypothetical protein